MPMTNTMTLRERRDGIATIESRAVFTSDPKAAPMPMGSLKMAYKFSGQQQGTVKMDEATGLVVRSEATQRMSGQIMMSGPGLPPGASSQLYQKGIITFESQEIVAPSNLSPTVEPPTGAKP